MRDALRWLGLAALVGCRPQPTVAPTDATSTTSTTADGGRAPHAAFVVHTSDSTIVIPLDPKHDVRTLDGTWTGARNAAYGRVLVHVAATQGPSEEPSTPIPICADADESAGCVVGPDGRLWAALDVRIESGKPLAWTLKDEDDRECPCIAVRGVSKEAERLDPEQRAEAEELGMDAREYIYACVEGERPELGPTSVMGGVLYMTGMGHEGTCDGRNIYTGAGYSIELRPGAAVPELEMPPVRACENDGFVEPLASWSRDRELDCVIGEDDCGCEDNNEMEAWFIRSGRIVQFTGNIDSAGGGCGCPVDIAATPGNCPSSTDPCGSTLGFPAIDPEVDVFWIATDGSAALVLRGDRVQLLGPKQMVLRDEKLGDEVIGVEFHADTLLIEGIALPTKFHAAWPALAPDDTAGPTASEWGDRCVRHLREKHWDHAEAACLAGLVEGGKDKTRGAIMYNLGRVAEARGDAATALQWYRRSDRLRPGNKTVLERITALGGK